MQLTEGQYFSIRRSGTSPDGLYFSISEIRLYQTPNLVTSATKVLTTYTATSATSPDNLVNNLGNRANRVDFFPLIGYDTLASFKSCFRADIPDILA